MCATRGTLEDHRCCTLCDAPVHVSYMWWDTEPNHPSLATDGLLLRHMREWGRRLLSVQSGPVEPDVVHMYNALSRAESGIMPQRMVYVIWPDLGHAAELARSS